MKTFKQLSIIALELAEQAFLKAHGWLHLNGRYYPPHGYPSKQDDAKRTGYVRAHAVNSQKQYVYNPTRGGTRQDPDIKKAHGR